MRGPRQASALKGVELEIYPDLLRAVGRELSASHRLVETIYEMELRLSREGARGQGDPVLAALVQERFRAAVRLTASLFLTAWSESAAVELPGWVRASPREEGRAP
jgi:hypothetical protein